MGAWLAKLLAPIIQSVAASFFKELLGKLSAWLSSMLSAGKVNKENKEESAKLDDAKEKLQEDLKKAGDDVQKQEDAIDDFFDSRR